MRTDAKHNFITQGSILAITGIVCRLIGMLYRIPLIDVIGTQGNGYYTSAYSIYNILLILSSYSLPTAISKVISVRLAHGRYDDVRMTLRVAFIYATLVGGLMCGIMFFFAHPIAVAMNKPFTEYALRTLAPTVWVMAYLGVLRGYFQGTGDMVPTAVSQIFEQVVNAVVSIVMAMLLFNYGLRANLVYNSTEYSYAMGAAGGTIGTGAGALVALLFFILLMLLYGRLPAGNGDEWGEARNAVSVSAGEPEAYPDDEEDVQANVSSRAVSRRRGNRVRSAALSFESLTDDDTGSAATRNAGRNAARRPRSRGRNGGAQVTGSARNAARGFKRETAGQIAVVLLITLLPILLSSTVYNISTVLDDFLFSRMMGTFGLAGSVVFLWGVFGEYRILFNIPVAMANSLSSSVIPSLTNAVAERNQRLVVQKIKLSQQFVMLISMPAAVGLFVLAEPICSLLFSGQDNTMLIQVLRRGAFPIILFSLSTITNGILQGLGYLSEPLRNAVIALILHVASLIGFMYVQHDIHAVIYANAVFALIVCVLNSFCMHRHVPYTLSKWKTFGVPFIASCIMGVVVFFVYFAMKGLLPAGFSDRKAGLALMIVVCIGIAILAYFPALIVLRAFNKEELLEMPMGLRLYKVLHRLGML